jgi:uncharacterized membrane protein required for colicin V production
VNLLDVIILAFGAVLVLLGILRGLLRLLLAAAAIGIGWWIAVHLHRPVAARLFGDAGGLAGLAAFGILFVSLAVVGLMAARLLSKAVRATPFRWVDRAAGGLLGLLAAIVLAAAFLLPLRAVLSPSHPLLAESRLASLLAPVAKLLEPLIPAEIRDALRQADGALRAAAGPEAPERLRPGGRSACGPSWPRRHRGPDAAASSALVDARSGAPLQFACGLSVLSSLRAV